MVYRRLIHHCSGEPSPPGLFEIFMNFPWRSSGVWYFRLGVTQCNCLTQSVVIRFSCRTNISANSISAGCDLTSLFPRFIVRGTLIHWFSPHTPSLEHSTGWLYCCNCWARHTSMESSQKQQPIYVISFCVFCLPQFYCWSHGSLLLPLDQNLLSITCYAFRSLSIMSSAVGVIVLQIYTILRRAAGIIIHMELISGEIRFRSSPWTLSDTSIRAYAAYISGILINVVGFAGASAPCCPFWSFPHADRFSSWQECPTCRYSNLSNVVLHRLWCFCTDLCSTQYFFPCTRFFNRREILGGRLIKCLWCQREHWRDKWLYMLTSRQKAAKYIYCCGGGMSYETVI